MKRDTTDPVDGVDRRSVLAAGAAGLSLSLSGCVETAQNVVDTAQNAVGLDGGEQLSLSIATVPNDYDPHSLRIARHLGRNLEAVGVDATVEYRDPAEFLEMILLDRDFDVYVGRHPGGYDPDFLYEALHSQFTDTWDGVDFESGWQNPFGYVESNPLLEAQRTATGDDRRDAIETLLEELVVQKPFEPICRAPEHRLTSDDLDVVDDWSDSYLGTRHGYLGIEPEDEDTERLTALITDSRPTSNLNPLSATNRERDTIVDLVYDSLGTVVPPEAEDDEYQVEPWLAESWETSTDADGRTTFEITLRENCPFHDYEVDPDDYDALDDDDVERDVESDDRTVTADDVVFTYRLLDDTTYTTYRDLSEASERDRPWPAPRYRGLASAVDDVDVVDDHTVQITVDANEAVAERVLTVPILPEHVYLGEVEEVHDESADEDRYDESTGLLEDEYTVEDAIDEYDDPQGRWDLVSSSGVPTIGSGPYVLADQSRRDHVTLERFDRDDGDVQHFSLRDDVDLPAPTAEELRFSVDPGDDTAVGRVRNGDAHVITSPLEAATVAGDDDLREAQPAPTTSFYHVGFNTELSSPLADVNLRQAVARLIDKRWVVDEVFYADPDDGDFNGQATPLATPFTEWDDGPETPSWFPYDLEIDPGEMPLDPAAHFVGDAESTDDGELDDEGIEAAHQLFRRYNTVEDGQVLANGN